MQYPPHFKASCIIENKQSKPTEEKGIEEDQNEIISCQMVFILSLDNQTKTADTKKIIKWDEKLWGNNTKEQICFYCGVSFFSFKIVKE